MTPDPARDLTLAPVPALTFILQKGAAAATVTTTLSFQAAMRAIMHAAWRVVRPGGPCCRGVGASVAYARAKAPYPNPTATHPYT